MAKFKTNKKLIFQFQFANNQPVVEKKEMQLKQSSNTFKLSAKESLKFGGTDFYSDTWSGMCLIDFYVLLKIPPITCT